MLNFNEQLQMKDGKYICIVEDFSISTLESGRTQLDFIVSLKNKERISVRYFLSEKSRIISLKELSNVFENKEKDIPINISDSELKEKCEMLKCKLRILTVKTKEKVNGQTFKEFLLGFV